MPGRTGGKGLGFVCPENKPRANLQTKNSVLEELKPGKALRQDLGSPLSPGSASSSACRPHTFQMQSNILGRRCTDSMSPHVRAVTQTQIEQIPKIQDPLHELKLHLWAARRIGQWASLASRSVESLLLWWEAVRRLERSYARIMKRALQRHLRWPSQSCHSQRNRAELI